MLSENLGAPLDRSIQSISDWLSSGRSANVAGRSSSRPEVATMVGRRSNGSTLEVEISTKINFDLDIDRRFWRLDYKTIICFGFGSQSTWIPDSIR
jgi:hypothetical protein